MTPDRIDDLLERALRTGAVPADATDEERAELEPLLARAGDLRLSAARVDAEASNAMPSARARFQRHLAAQRPIPAAAPPAKKSGGLLSWFGGRTVTWAGSAAAIAVIAVIALVVLQPFSSVETASALTVDDYVQVQGVVSATSDGTLTVQSPELGNLDIAVSDATVTDDSGAREVSSLKPGDPVLVSGVVTARRAIAASNVAVAANQAVPTPVGERKLPILKAFRQGLEGTLSLFSLSPDGTRARVLLVLPRESILVDIEPASMDQFLAGNPSAIGARVRVVQGTGLPAGVFRLEAIGGQGNPATPPAGTAGTPQFQGVRGVVVSRVANVLMVRTDRGTVPVVIQRATSLRFGQSGLTVEDVRDGQVIIGHEVAVSGNLEQPGGRRVIATLIVVLPKPGP
ncbi:MAG: hypothetical protein AB7J35_08865 [Dehalococcoidia bacterium]